MRELVQDPMNTVSILISVMGMFGVRPMYSNARAVAWRWFSSVIMRGSGTR